MTTSITVPQLDTKSSHISDTEAQAFLQPNFDPADYLNNALPSLSTKGTSSGRHVPLPELSAQLQTLLFQLNAQTSRLSNTLTRLTDEIVRSGGRLAYEVEVLRAETTGLTDSLENGLRKDIEVFAPTQPPAAALETEEDGVKAAEKQASTQPEYLERLQTLSSVRERLDEVIKTFGDAMAWPLAPSELSMASSIISVSAPGNEDDARNREEKGKAYMDKLRGEINDLLTAGEVAAAEQRIEQMRKLAEVWKGTAEEKARIKLVESLQKLVEERQRMLQPGGKSGQGGRRPTPSPSRGGDLRYGDREGGYGFLQNLKKLGGDVYLD